MPPERRPDVVLAFDAESGDLYGYGAWAHARANFEGQAQSVIRIPRFGVDRRFKGSVDSEGNKCAGTLYATLEEHARSHEDSSEAMLIELFCDERNERGLRFWRARGFRYLETVESPSGRYQRFVR